MFGEFWDENYIDNETDINYGDISDMTDDSFGEFSNPDEELHGVLDKFKDGKWMDNAIDNIEDFSGKTHKCGKITPIRDIKCLPHPDAFSPCEDVMGYMWLRIVVWFVVVTAIFGNLLVLVVTLVSKYKVTVPKFLMCNLCTADFFLGLYLLMLASFDLYSSGIYFNYAFHWQYGPGCQIAGFMSTFSSSLSIYTLTVITIERWYAISHAIHITKRMRLKQASYIMTFGWVLSLFLATLPLFGVSSYGKTSICLPMDTTDYIDLIYILSLLLINLVCFMVICGCYIDMYRQVHGEQTAAGRNDANIAKRMAILVFTDFACFFPLAFFGLTAAAGKPLITVTDSKILLVFFFPLNACCNPFLYAIITKQFKKDLFSMLSQCGLCQKHDTRFRQPYSSNLQYSSNPHVKQNIYNQVVHRSSQGSVRSTYFSSKCSMGTSQGSQGTPNTSPKSKKRSLSYVSPPSSSGSLGKYQTGIPQLVGSIQTTFSGKELRKLSVVPETSPNKTSPDIKESPSFKKFASPDSNDQHDSSIEKKRAVMNVRSVSQYSSSPIQKQGSFDYDRLINLRKGSESTTISGSTCTTTTDMSLLSSERESVDYAAIIEPIEEIDHEEEASPPHEANKLISEENKAVAKISDSNPNTKIELISNCGQAKTAPEIDNDKCLNQNTNYTKLTKFTKVPFIGAQHGEKV